MRSEAIQKLIDEVEKVYGPITLYGSSPEEEHGTCFSLGEIFATFSVHTQEGTLAKGLYDVQIEGMPAGDYVYTKAVSSGTFMNLIKRIQGPDDSWPKSSEELS